MVICKENNYMQYWLMKLEPDVWSINQQKSRRKELTLVWCKKSSYVWMKIGL